MSHFLITPSFLSKSIFAAAILISASMLSAQDNPPASTSNTDPSSDAPADKQQDDQEASLTYQEIVSKIRENEKTINHLLSTIPLGFPKRQAQHMTKVAELKEANRELRTKVTEAALRAFRQAPMADPVVTRAVFGLISAKLEPRTLEDRFDPKAALELAEMMLEKIPASETETATINEVTFQAFRACYAMGDFDRADSFLKRLADAQIAVPQRVMQEYAYTKEQWEKESIIRQREAAADDLPRVKFETSEGDFTVELFENQAPQTVGNFISLVENKFYDDLLFFMVQPGVHAMTGCKNNDGSGDVAYWIPCECYGEDPRMHFSGTLSMIALARDKGSSQFLITLQANRFRDGKQTAFGRVIDGMDVVLRLNVADPRRNISQTIKPSSIIKASVIRKRDHPYSPTRIDKNGSSTIPSGGSQESALGAGKN